MITIQGTYTSALIYANSIDSGTEGLLRALCNSPISQGSTIRIMPDVHAGKGCAIGTTMTVTNCVMPGLVGVDIGCGMTVSKVKAKRFDPQKLDKLIHQKVPAGRAIRTSPHRFTEQIDLNLFRCVRHIQSAKALLALGTLGGGNHFIELDQDEKGNFWLIVHSGSRHLGFEVEHHYHELAFKETTPEGIPYEFATATGSLMDDYLNDLSLAQSFAEKNRLAITDEIVRGMKWDVEDQFSSVHNYIDLNERMLRKGAVSAKEGERLIIPMNMRDGCLLCVGKGNIEWNCSAPHGAGRLMSRMEAKQSFTLSQFKKEMTGIYSTTISRETLDESPMVYKPMNDIIDQLEPTAEIIERLKPIYNFKAGEE